MEVLQRHLLQATLRALDMAMMNQQEVQEYLIIRGDSIPPAVVNIHFFMTKFTNIYFEIFV